MADIGLSAADFEGLVAEVLDRLARDPAAKHLWRWRSRPGCSDQPVGRSRREHLGTLLGLVGVGAIQGFLPACSCSDDPCACADDPCACGDDPCAADAGPRDGAACGDDPCADDGGPRDAGSMDAAGCGDDPCAADSGPTDARRRDAVGCADDPCACADDPCSM